MNDFDDIEPWSCESWLAKPLDQREWYGFYLRPLALEWDDWPVFEDYLKETYPVQYFFRNGYNTIVSKCKKMYNCLYVFYLCVCHPANPIVRAAVPRKWADLDDVMVEVNLAIIKQFNEELDGRVACEDDMPENIEFLSWMKDAMAWIERREVIYNELRAGEQLSVAEVHALKNEIHTEDSRVIKEMIDRRNHFWT